VAGLIATAILFAVPNLGIPNEARMRAFRLSVLTDENLRDLHTKATAQVEAAHADWDKQIKELVAEREAEIAECSSKIFDVAYKTRNYPDGCPRPIWPDGLARPRMQSVSEAYEALIMNGCHFQRTVLEARFAGCLP
jgi:hypothetical protein